MPFHNFEFKRAEPSEVKGQIVQARILECIHCKAEVKTGIMNLINHLEECIVFQKTEEAAFIRGIMHAGDPWRKA